jgi:hypothetical protein
MSQIVQRPPTPGSPDAVLVSARAAKQAQEAAEVQVLVHAVEWASRHEPVEDRDTAYWWASVDVIPLAGVGAPALAEFAVADFAAALGLTTDAGRALLAQAIELAHRLPKTWAQVQLGRVPAWRARRVADHTLDLTPQAAGFIDAQVAAVAGRIGSLQLDRLVTEARRRFMGDRTGADEYSLPDTRRVRIDADQVSFDGTVHLDGELDLADALDLDQALAVTAEQLKQLGSVEPLDARRASALGELARNQLALTFDSDDKQQDAPRRSGRDRRPVTLFLHLSESARTGSGGVGRCENTRTPIDAEAIRAWCGHPDTTLTVKPVIDVADHIRVDAYQVPDRIRSQVELRDGGCVFPWCTRPARVCDHDHAIPFDSGGSTCSCNIAALCRHHHRLKTLTPWRYVMPEPGVYVWTSPHGYAFLRDHTGTMDVTPSGLTPVPGCPPDP